MNNISLYYGDSFAGRYYSMKVGDRFHGLGDRPTLGGPEHEAAARERARQILGPERAHLIDGMPFRWNGTL